MSPPSTDNLAVALIQLDAGTDVAANVVRAEEMARQAADEGAQLICLPEMYQFRSTGPVVKLPGEEVPGPSTEGFQRLAAAQNVAVLCGGFCEAIPGERRVHNTSILFAPDGSVAARYRKIHLFDVEVDGTAIRESDWYVAGEEPAVGEVFGRKIGLSVCYDLRFPELYRAYAALGADILTVPASFTATTGRAHWESLLRARAIENQAFVLAPNQVGLGSGAVSTYGHSLVADPWGDVLACGGAESTEIVTTTLDFARLADVRRRLPSLRHRRLG